jgi:hypothetical protein
LKRKENDEFQFHQPTQVTIEEEEDTEAGQDPGEVGQDQEEVARDREEVARGVETEIERVDVIDREA